MLTLSLVPFLFQPPAETTFHRIAVARSVVSIVGVVGVAVVDSVGRSHVVYCNILSVDYEGEGCRALLNEANTLGIGWRITVLTTYL